MKEARPIDFAGTGTPDQAMRLLLRVRFAECLEKQHALNGGDDDAVHAFRLACKRLRYAIERWEDAGDGLKPVIELLTKIAEELGAAHDCVVLAKRASQCEAQAVVRRALRDRDRYKSRGKRLWYEAFNADGTFEPLASLTGFHWNATGNGMSISALVVRH